MKPGGLAWQHVAKGLVLGAVEIAAVTAIIVALKDVIPVYALTSLYVLAMLPLAVWWGTRMALGFAVASTAAFDVIVTPPQWTLTITDADTASLLVISLVIAWVVSELSGRAQGRAREAESLARRLQRVAAEQAALRRVATLVARGEPPEEVFGAVAGEVGRVLPGVDQVCLNRYDAGRAITIVGSWSNDADVLLGARRSLGGRNVSTLVFDTGRPARIDHYGENASGPIGAFFRDLGARSMVGVPISVEGRPWGAIAVASTRGESLPRDTEERLTDFTELVVTAIGNAESQAQLSASRARIVAAGDQVRRRIERDLHDGAQQRLISLGLRLRTVQAALPSTAGTLYAQLGALADEATGAVDELRELAQGIHPAILADHGLGPALKALARRCTIPVELQLHGDDRLPEQIETAAYFVVSEALTNAVKHAQASVVQVEVGAPEGAGGAVDVLVRDDGRGGAAFAGGSGLVGLKDRVVALGGALEIESAPGSGTALHATLPVTPP